VALVVLSPCPMTYIIQNKGSEVQPLSVFNSVFGIFSPNLKRPIYGYFSPFFSHVAPAMLLKKGKNYPKMISFLLSAKNPEHALKE
jgi:hypothetical protein